MLGLVSLSMAVAAMWGASPVIYKRILGKVSHQSLLVFHGVLFALCVLVWALWHKEKVMTDFFALDRQDWTWVVVSVLSGGFLATLIYFYLIENHKSYLVVALTYSAPLFTALLARWWLGEDISYVGAVGVVLIVVGVALLVYR